MWQISTFLAAGLAAVAAAASDGSIIIFDSAYSHQQPHDTVHEDAAKLLLQQRMLSTQDLASAALEEPVLELLNTYGGVQNTLFDETPRNSQQKLLVIIDGLVKDASAIKPKTSTVTLPISRISSNFMDTSTIESLLASQEKSTSGLTRCVYEAVANPELQVSNSYGLQSCLPHRFISTSGMTKLQKKLLDGLPLSSLEVRSNSDGSKGILRLTFTSNTVDPSVAVQFLDSLFELFDPQEQTFVLLPEANSKAHRNQLLGKRSTFSENTKRSQKGAVSSTFAPVCYGSNSSCTAATDNCSGHGTCSLKSTLSKDNGCYACQCRETRIKNADGSFRTIQWGGSACEKEDISVPFFLLASITVVAILAVGAGISMLFSVGQQELPSVINAGVSSVKPTG